MQLLSLSSGVYITPSPAAYIVVTMQVPLLLRLGVNLSPNYTSPIGRHQSIVKVSFASLLEKNFPSSNGHSLEFGGV